MHHKFHSKTGVNIDLSSGCLTARRKRNPSQSLVFSHHVLDVDELFEVKLEELDAIFSGGLTIGLTSYNVDDSNTKISHDMGHMSDTWWVDGSSVFRCNQVTKLNFGPSLDRLNVGDKVGVKRSADGAMKIVINGEDIGAACVGVTAGTRAVVGLSGSVTSVTVTSCYKVTSPQEESQASQSLHSILEKEGAGETTEENNIATETLEFHDNRGRNVALCHANTIAKRNDSYNQGIVMSARPLTPGTMFQVLISHLTPRWSSGLSLGVTGHSPDQVHLPVSLLHLKRDTWVISGDGVYTGGVKTRSGYGPNLNSLTAGHNIGVLVDTDHRLHLYVNSVDQGAACDNIPDPCWAVFDLYGKCDEIVISNPGESQADAAFVKETGVKEEKENKNIMTSSLKMELLPQTISRNCSYLALCKKFQESLGLPKLFFDCDKITCYCETCHKLRHEELIQSQGEPRKKYALPIGWVKFVLRPARDHSDDHDTWHVAYHGTNPGWVRRMLDTGKLLTQGTQSNNLPF